MNRRRKRDSRILLDYTSSSLVVSKKNDVLVIRQDTKGRTELNRGKIADFSGRPERNLSKDLPSVTVCF